MVSLQLKLFINQTLDLLAKQTEKLKRCNSIYYK